MKLICMLLASSLLVSCNSTTCNSVSESYIQPVFQDEAKIYPIAIIGSGAAGTMAVKRAVLNNDHVLLFLGANQEKRHARGTWVRKVDNVPGLERYDRPILELCNETLIDIARGPFASNLYTVEDSVLQIEKSGDVFKLKDAQGRIYYAKHVLLATGMMDEQPMIQGTIRSILDFSNGQTVAYCPICDGHRCLGKNTAIIGYRDDAAAAAIQLANQYHTPSLSIITNGKTPEFSETTLDQLKQRQIAIYTSPIYNIHGDRNNRQLAGFQLKSGEIINAEMGYVMLGIRPNNALALQLGANVDNRGLVLTDPNGETSVPNLFVAGDLRSGSMKQIYTAWQHAVESIQTINARIK